MDLFTRIEKKMKTQGISRKLIVSIIAIVVVVAAVFMLKKPSQPNVVATNNESVEIEIVDIDGKQINDKSIEIEDGDTLASLVEENFDNVKIEDGFLYTIDKLTTPEDWSTFIAIYVNDEMAEVGINDIQLKDGDKYSFVDTKMEY